MRVDSTVESVVERVAAIDIGKEEVVVCVRVPGPVEGQRSSEIRTFPTMTADLLELSQWLTDWGVRRVVMEATGDYWKPVFYVLEGSFEETWLVNAHDVKHVPGRPKTDRLDAQWLARLAEKGMLRPSFVPPPPLRELRDLTRYRVDLVVSRTAEKQRVEKLLEDAGVKLSVVATDIFGVSGRRMLKALAAGERDPQKLANLALSVLRRKLDRLERSFVGRFNAHHGFLLGRMLRRVEDLDADIAAIEAQIEAHVQPFPSSSRTRPERCREPMVWVGGAADPGAASGRRDQLGALHVASASLASQGGGSGRVVDTRSAAGFPGSSPTQGFRSGGP